MGHMSRRALTHVVRIYFSASLFSCSDDGNSKPFPGANLRSPPCFGGASGRPFRRISNFTEEI